MQGMSNKEKYTRVTGAQSVGEALKFLEGRWKLLILFQLFGGEVVRFSQLERGIPGITQKMLSQQLRQLEKDGLVERTAYPEVPPRVDYRLTEWGQALCPALDALLTWANKR
jgi:DNA-binding HxlR family transcriptional regulator